MPHQAVDLADNDWLSCLMEKEYPLDCVGPNELPGAHGVFSESQHTCTRDGSTDDLDCFHMKADLLPQDLRLFDEFKLPTLDELLGDCPEESMSDAPRGNASHASSGFPHCEAKGGCCHSDSKCCATSQLSHRPSPTATPPRVFHAAGKAVVSSSGTEAATSVVEQHIWSAAAPHTQAIDLSEDNSGSLKDEPSSSHNRNISGTSLLDSGSNAESNKRQRTSESPEMPLRMDVDERASSPTPNHSEGSRAGSPQGDDPEEEQKRMARMQRNRESAMQSRQRKKMQMDELERHNRELQTQNTHLTGLVAGLTAENAALRHQLGMFQGRPIPNGVPPQMHQQQQQPGMVPSSVPMAPVLPSYMPWMPGMPGLTPKVPIQRLPQTRPAKPEGSSRSKKKAKVAAGSTALLALFCFFAFMGPVPFWPQSGISIKTYGEQAYTQSYAALPASPHAGGRVLQAIPSSDNSTAAYLDNTTLGSQEVDWHHENGLVPLHTSSTTFMPGSAGKKARATALQLLKDLAPLTLYSDWGLEGGFAKVWEKTASVGNKGSASLLPPMHCKEVFSLNASPNVDAAAARRQLQNYLATMSSYRGRALPGILAMPPVSRSLPTSQEDGSDGSGFKTTIEDSSSINDSVIVSVMLPAHHQAQADTNGTRSFTALDEMYVVTVNPTKRYVTYACALPSPVMV